MFANLKLPILTVLSQLQIKHSKFFSEGTLCIINISCPLLRANRGNCTSFCFLLYFYVISYDSLLSVWRQNNLTLCERCIDLFSIKSQHLRKSCIVMEQFDLNAQCHLLSDVILSAWNLKMFTNFFKFVVFVGKEWCFIIWLNTSYYTTKVSVINTQSSININL